MQSLGGKTISAKHIGCVQITGKVSLHILNYIKIVQSPLSSSYPLEINLY